MTSLIDERAYAVVDRLRGINDRNLRRGEVADRLMLWRSRAATNGWTTDLKVFYRDGSDVTLEFRT